VGPHRSVATAGSGRAIGAALRTGVASRRTLVPIAVPTVALLIALAGCDGITRTDARFSTPEHTVHTLLSAYGFDALTQEEARARLATQDRFELIDRDAYRACFEDLGPIENEGLAGWVVGALASGKDELRTEIIGERATVSPREGVRIVMRRDATGGWRIVLRESVPEDVRRALITITARAEQRARATGILVR
jgi:hypothetical protein